MDIDMDRFVAMDLDKKAKPELLMLHANNGTANMYPTNLIIDTSVVSLYSSNATTPTGTATTASTAITTATSTATATVSSTASSSVSQTAVQSASRTTCLSPEPSNKAEADHDIIWQVLLDLSRVVIEAKKDHQLLAAEIEDLMVTLESHCQLLGLDPVNVTHLCIPVLLAPITLATRQALYRACDDMYKDILRRKDGIDRWISRIITIAENIHEPPGPYLESSMPEMSRARILELERTYRTLEKEWLERLHRFQAMVGLLRIRWDQCAYLPNDEYDWALNRLFELAEIQDSAMDVSLLRIEAPLCLSKECLARLELKLLDLNQNYYTRQSRIKAMEHVLGLIYQDLGTHDDLRVFFRNEATVKYAAELGRELKALQVELAARKEYQSGERWVELALVWDTCLVSKEEREEFRATLDTEDITFVQKVERIQSEIENCHVRFSRCESVYKLMMTRSNHIERMIAFEHTASDPKRLFQPSFQLVEEEKFRRRAYPALLKLESTLVEAIEKYEREHDNTFMYEGAPYLSTLQAEIANRHVNETVFAKFTPVIATPTRSQTAFIMGRPVSPVQTPPSSTPTQRPTPLRHSTFVARSQDTSDVHNRRSLTLPAASNSSSQVVDPLVETISDRHPSSSSLESSPLAKTPRSTPQRRSSPSNSTVSMGSNHSLKSKSSTSSLTGAQLTSLLSESLTRTNNSPYYGTPISRGSSPASSTSSLSSVPSSTPMRTLTSSKSLPSLFSTLEGKSGATIERPRFGSKAKSPPSSPSSTVRSRQQPFK
ncbi:hypothetical protein CPB97_011319 [Podila verticillata]|nr:hypothetical protein CPB97_011319 [Podila verticillata]